MPAQRRTPVADQFDLKLHHVVNPRRFSDLRVGESFRSPSRTMTEAYFAAFQAISGDNHPIHHDLENCRHAAIERVSSVRRRAAMAFLTGLSAFPITPSDANGRVDVSGLRHLLSRLTAATVDSIGLLGSTGSYAYLSREERRRAVETAVEAVDGRCPILVGVGACAPRVR